jgi:hypothetical protein
MHVQVVLHGIIAKSTTSQPESTEMNPSCSLIDACAGRPPRYRSRRGAIWRPQPRHHAAALPSPDRNRILTPTLFLPTTGIRHRSPSSTVHTVVASKSERRSRRTPLHNHIYLSRTRIREDWRTESEKFVVDLRQEKGKRGISPSIWRGEWINRGLAQSIYELGWEKWGWSTVERRKRNWNENGWGGGPVEVSQNKLKPTKNLGPAIKFVGHVTCPSKFT